MSRHCLALTASRRRGRAPPRRARSPAMVPWMVPRMEPRVARRRSLRRAGPTCPLRPQDGNHPEPPRRTLRNSRVPAGAAAARASCTRSASFPQGSIPACPDGKVCRPTRCRCIAIRKTPRACCSTSTPTSNRLRANIQCRSSWGSSRSPKSSSRSSTSSGKSWHCPLLRGLGRFRRLSTRNSWLE